MGLNDQMTASDPRTDIVAAALKTCGDAIDANEQRCEGVIFLTSGELLRLKVAVRILANRQTR